MRLLGMIIFAMVAMAGIATIAFAEDSTMIVVGTAAAFAGIIALVAVNFGDE